MSKGSKDEVCLYLTREDENFFEYYHGVKFVQNSKDFVVRKQTMFPFLTSKIKLCYNCFW